MVEILKGINGIINNKNSPIFFPLSMRQKVISPPWLSWPPGGHMIPFESSLGISFFEWQTLNLMRTQTCSTASVREFAKQKSRIELKYLIVYADFEFSKCALTRKRPNSRCNEWRFFWRSIVMRFFVCRKKYVCRKVEFFISFRMKFYFCFLKFLSVLRCITCEFSKHLKNWSTSYVIIVWK